MSFPEIIPNSHPIFVHFPIALITLSTALFIGSILISSLNWKEKLTNASLINLWAGTAMSAITIGTGLWAARSIAHNKLAHTAMETHEHWGLYTGVLLLALTLYSIKALRSQQPLKTTFLIGLIIATGMVTTTGWLGGELVFRYGVGVISEQKLSESEIQVKSHKVKPKSHDHNDGHDH